MTPLLLLDVDGVLNALPEAGEHDAVWSQWRRGRAQADGSFWPILWAPAVVDRLRSWHEDGRLEIQWLTTWGHDANLELRRLLDLPTFAVPGTYAESDQDARTTADAASHAAAAPSAPDPLSGSWWKYDVVRRVLTEHPGRQVIWVDDELHHRAGTYRRWAEQETRVLAIGPDPRTGLAERDLQEIEQRVAACTPADVIGPRHELGHG